MNKSFLGSVVFVGSTLWVSCAPRGEFVPGPPSPAPLCTSGRTDLESDGRKQEKNCRLQERDAPTEKAQPSGQKEETSASLVFQTTYYPFGIEEYPKTTCGDAEAFQGMYFAVTEGSPLWSGTCRNESWAPCENADCLSKWAQIPDDAKRVDQGRKMVREPSCDVPCGRRHRIRSLDDSVEVVAVIYDACPHKHWNNRLKEVTLGKNPCAFGSQHVDLRKPLYLRLSKGTAKGNISVQIDPEPLEASGIPSIL